MGNGFGTAATEDGSILRSTVAERSACRTATEDRADFETLNHAANLTEPTWTNTVLAT